MIDADDNDLFRTVDDPTTAFAVLKASVEMDPVVETTPGFARTRTQGRP